jgi:hypothetical protein
LQIWAIATIKAAASSQSPTVVCEFYFEKVFGIPNENACASLEVGAIFLHHRPSGEEIHAHPFIAFRYVNGS